MITIEELKLQKMWRESNAYLIALVGDKYVDEWWKRPNRAFDGKSPFEIWNDNPKKVYQYLVTAGDGYW